MQQYKSDKNIEIDRAHLERTRKMKGEIPFELDANNSGRIVTKFTKEFEDVPMIITSVVITSGSEFNIMTVLTNVTKTEFTINIQNAGDSEAKGYISWFSA